MKRWDVRTLLDPIATEDTQQLVAQSALQTMEDFVRVCEIWRLFGKDSVRDDATAALELLCNEDISVTIRRFSSPVFRGWLAKLMQIGLENYSTERFCALSRELNNCFYSPLTHKNFSKTFAVIGEFLHFWDVRVAMRIPNEEFVKISVEANEIKVESINSGRTLFEGHVVSEMELEGESRGAKPEPPVVYLPDTEVAVRNDIAPLRLVTTDSSERDKCVILDGFEPSEEVYGPFVVDGFLKASQILRDAWHMEYADLASLLHVIVPRDVPPHWKKRGWSARGMTVSSHQGAVWLYVRSWDDVYEHLVHELSHVKLRYIEEAEPILAPNQTAERFKVGWRTDPRPIIGIYEGVYVHIHCLNAMRAAIHRGFINEGDALSLEQRIQEITDKVRYGVEILRKQAIFTKRGKCFIDWAVDRGELAA